jgi:aflatoxin B1 aldehyde reductase
MAKRFNLIFGVAALGNAGSMGVTPEDASDESTLQIFEILKKHNINQLDTGRLYGKAEEGLGRLKAGTELGYNIDTKWVGGFFDPATTTRDRIVADAKDSFGKLGAKVHTFYLHSPAGYMKLEDEDTLVGIDEAHKLGIFKHFGLSNFSPEQVQHVYDICKAKRLVLPTIYEGLYNPVNRKPEDELFPLLRKLGIAINAYSPLAGGFLTKTKSHVMNGEGRFAKDKFRGLYGEIYNNENFLDALEEWQRIGHEEGASPAQLAYRWMCYHSSLSAEFGDGILLGGRLPQLEETFESINRGPLSEKAVKGIEVMWEKLQPHVKYTDNLQAMVAVAARGGGHDRL